MRSSCTLNTFLDNWRKSTAPHGDSLNIFLPQNKPHRFRCANGNGKSWALMSRLRKGWAKALSSAPVLTAPLIRATCSNTQTPINNSGAARSRSTWVSRSRGNRRAPVPQTVIAPPPTPSPARSPPANANRHAKQIVCKCLEKAAVFAPGPNKIIFTSYPRVIRAERIEFPWQWSYSY